jgi:hypothetical protein
MDCALRFRIGTAGDHGFNLFVRRDAAVAARKSAIPTPRPGRPIMGLSAAIERQSVKVNPRSPKGRRAQRGAGLRRLARPAHPARRFRLRSSSFGVTRKRRSRARRLRRRDRRWPSRTPHPAREQGREVFPSRTRRACAARPTLTAALFPMCRQATGMQCESLALSCNPTPARFNTKSDAQGLAKRRAARRRKTLSTEGDNSAQAALPSRCYSASASAAITAAPRSASDDASEIMRSWPLIGTKWLPPSFL